MLPCSISTNSKRRRSSRWRRGNTSSSSQENNIRVSRLGFHEKEASQDKGLLARYLASFVMSLDEAVMESLVESRNRTDMYESGGKQSKSDDPPLQSQSSEVSPPSLCLLNSPTQILHICCYNGCKVLHEDL